MALDTRHGRNFHRTDRSCHDPFISSLIKHVDMSESSAEDSNTSRYTVLNFVENND
jgi:hypothetical protein